MPKLLKTCLIALTLLLCGAAGAAEPSDESIRALFVAANSKALLEGLQEKINPMIQQQMRQVSADRKLNPRQKLVVDKMGERMTQYLQSEISWEHMEPIYMRLYKKTFTQEEVDGITRFYSTPEGQALIKKMPALMTNLMGEMQALMSSMQSRFEQITRETAAELAKPEPSNL